MVWKITENNKTSKGQQYIYGLVPYNNGVVMIKKPISPNFDHSNRFLTDYILPHQEPRNRLLVTPYFYC